MVLELHIWGSAFGLPSIDAQCLAAVSYLRLSRQHNDWVLAPSSDPRVCPHGELPALRDGDLWVAGYLNIVAYLRDVSDGEWDLHRDFNLQQRADNKALTAFITSRGQPLLDLCLYVSSDNYHDCTRPALAHILSWPNSWIIPHRLRDQAKRRSEHLGLSSLDLDTAQEEEEKKANTGLAAQIPKSLRTSKQTVTSLLGRSQQKNRFRLDAVTEGFFEPLTDMLKDQKWLLGDHPSSADCLAIAYLALMQVPELKLGWLAEALRTKHTKLSHWALKSSTELFGTSSEAREPLPWRSPIARRWPQICHDVLEECIGAVPVVGTAFSVQEVNYLRADGKDRAEKKQVQLVRLRRRRDLYLEILTSTLASAGVIAWMVHEGMLRFPRWTPGPTKARFGEAGVLLGLG